MCCSAAGLLPNQNLYSYRWCYGVYTEIPLQWWGGGVSFTIERVADAAEFEGGRFFFLQNQLVRTGQDSAIFSTIFQGIDCHVTSVCSTSRNWTCFLIVVEFANRPSYYNKIRSPATYCNPLPIRFVQCSSPVRRLQRSISPATATTKNRKQNTVMVVSRTLPVTGSLVYEKVSPCIKCQNRGKEKEIK